VFYTTRLKLRQEAYGLSSAIDYAMLGRKDQAFRDLNRALEDDPFDSMTWIRRPEYGSLHADSRYDLLLRRLNLAQ